MKKKFILFPLVLVLIYVVGSSYSGGAAVAGGIDGTGATTTAGCNCHTSATSTTVAIELDTAGGTPVTHYVAGGSYTIKITGTNTSTTSLPKFGFQVAAVKSTGAGTAAATNAGTLGTTGLPASCQNSTVASINVIEQTNSINATTGTGGSGTTYVVSSIPWTAPVAGTGSIKLYGVINAVNGTGSTGGDKWNNANVTITELTAPVAPITGTFTVCVGANTTLSDATTGGTWSSGTTTVATVTSTGVVHGVSPGTSVISYNAGAAGTATATVTVVGPPTAGTITGVASVCIGSTLTLANTTATGTGAWSTTTPAIATVNSSTGAVTGIATGTANIVYTATTSCGSSTTSASVPVITTPVVAAISGGSALCVGSSLTLTDATASGVWSSGAPAIATVNSSGVVTALASGTAIISYTVSNTCGSTNAIHTMVMTALPNAGNISGSTFVCQSNTISLVSSGMTGGTWSSSIAGVATVGSSSGVVTGVGVGNTTITYTVTNSCGFDTATYTVTCSAPPNTDYITGNVNICTGSTTTLHDPVAGGTWTIANPLLATVTAAAGDSGVITGLAAGSTTVSYTASNSCGSYTTTRPLTINDPVTAGAISGPSAACAGASISFTYTGSLGTGTSIRWHSSNTTVATVGLTTGSGTALATGNSFISLAYTNACSSDSLVVPLTVNPAPNAGSISGAGAVCVASSITLTDAVTGGTWTSGSPTVASVNGSGVVTGISGGTAIISYSVTNSCGTAVAVHTVLVNSSATAGTISGATSVCQSSSITLSSTVSGGSWTSGAPAVATINSSGVVTGLSSGSATITYTATNACGTATTTYSVTVNPLPVAGSITGAGSVCVGASITLTDLASGGSWTSNAPTVATVNATGVVSGLTAGTAIISYTVTNGCGSASAIQTVVVSGPPSAGTISGSAFVCIGTSSTLSDGVTGGTWSSNNTAVVTVSPTGVATGVGSGSATISYSVSGTCGTGIATYTVSSSTSASAGTITGPSAVCVGSTMSLVDLAGGGIWSSSNTSVATINALGTVFGVSGGTTTISYTVTTACGTAVATYGVTVNPLPIAGVITGPVNVCVGSSVSLAESVPGGVWSSTAPSVATVDPSGNVTGVSAGTFIVVYSVTNGCGTVTALHTMISNAVPVLATIAGSNSVCQGSSSTLSASAPGGVWSVSSSIATVSSTGVVTGLSYGVETIYYTISNICDTTVASFVDTVFPTTIVAGIMGSSIACIGDTFQYAVAVPGGTFTLSNGNAVVDPVTGTLIPVSAGTDTLTYSLTNICGTASASMTINVLTAAQCATVGVSNAQGLQGIRIYPNPTDGLFNIEMPKLSASAIVTITDIFGKVIETRMIDAGNSITSFDLSSLSAGNYLIKITSGDQTFRDKIVIW